MALPSPALSVPSLSNDMIGVGTPSGSTLLMGTGTPFLFTKITGLDLPDIRSGNQPRAQTRGAWVGANLPKTRIIEATLDVGGHQNFGSYVNLAGCLNALTSAVFTSGATEYPLWIQLPNQPLVCCMARALKHNTPWDITADLGGLARSTMIQWEATDSYLYAAPTQSVTVSLPGPGGGFRFPLTFPLSFGGATTPNTAVCTNNGNVACRPVLVVNGPCLNPSISNLSVTGNPTVSLSCQLYSGDQVVIDTDTHSIMYYPSGSSTGTPEGGWLNSGSSFFSIPVGSSTIAFNSQDTTTVSGTLQVWWTSTYSGLL